MSLRQSVICPGCGAQCAAAVAAAHGWSEHGCPKCPPTPTPSDPHPLAVAFAWWPDYSEAHPDARAVYTATCGCGWSVAARSEHHAWHAVWNHAGVLDAWAARPLLDRPRPDAGPRDRRRMRWEIEAARLHGVPMRTLMACRDDGSGRRRHPCRGVVPAGPGPAELYACPCHAGPDAEPDPCRHCGATVGHLGRCPRWGPPRHTPRPPEAQPTLF